MARTISGVAQANPARPTVAELNTSVKRLRISITCALDEDGSSLTLGSSDLDSTLTYCDGAGVSRPTKANPELTLSIRRDMDRNAQGVFNEALDWLKHAAREEDEVLPTLLGKISAEENRVSRVLAHAL